jgi:hypothetical protein
MKLIPLSAIPVAGGTATGYQAEGLRSLDSSWIVLEWDASCRIEVYARYSSEVVSGRVSHPEVCTLQTFKVFNVIHIPSCLDACQDILLLQKA